MLNIITYPNPILREISKPVLEVNDEVRSFIKELSALMFTEGGIGIAAPQVADLRRIFITEGRIIQFYGENHLTFEAKQGELNPPNRDYVVFINPEISYLTDETVFTQEGCLSVPDVSVQIDRIAVVRVNYLNELGESCTLIAEDMAAIVIQHENSHLDGQLIVDFVNSEQ